MKIADNHLIHLPVYSQSGEWLGRVVRFTIDCDHQQVIEYVVAQFPYIHALSPERTIPHIAVTSITAEKMVVDDGLVRIVEPSSLTQRIPTVPSVDV